MKGVAAYFPKEFYSFDEEREWCANHFRRAIFTPEQIVAVADPEPDWDSRLEASGIYFLQRAGKICYIGKASALSARLEQHRRQRRPFDSVTVIAGIPRDWLSEFEAAYIQAWSPPWNAAWPAGSLPWYHEMLATLEAMPRDLICDQPELPPLTGDELAAMVAKLDSALDFGPKP